MLTGSEHLGGGQRQSPKNLSVTREGDTIRKRIHWRSIARIEPALKRGTTGLIGVWIRAVDDAEHGALILMALQESQIPLAAFGEPENGGGDTVLFTGIYDILNTTCRT